MNVSKYYIFILILLVTILSACSSAENKSTSEMDGIELKLSINKEEISSDDAFVAKVTLTNMNDSKRKVYVPTTKDIDEGISAVMVEREGENLWQLLNPKDSKAIPNIKERTFYDFVLVELEANKTIEQEFSWNKELLNQENIKVEKAESGEYLLSTFIILDDINNQVEYYEPEKQLITKLNFTVK